MMGADCVSMNFVQTIKLCYLFGIVDDELE